MWFEKEIERAVRHQVASDTESQKSSREIENIVKEIKSIFDNKEYCFDKSLSLILKQKGKKRLVKEYKDRYSSESVLCQCIKQIVDKTFKIKYPNRNNIINSLFNIISTVKDMSNFTIVKFDFKNYFNSVSATYVFEKFIKSQLTNRLEIELISDFVEKTKYTYAGFSTSNAFAEIIAKQFDIYIKQILIKKGLLYYQRYIDDSILILNEDIGEEEIKGLLDQALKNIFYDTSVNTTVKCKTKFNEDKFKYISKHSILESQDESDSVDFLGYEFGISKNNKKIAIKYGITDSKLNKYKSRIDKLISYYTNKEHSDYNNMELLRHRIASFSSRTVYLNKKFKSNVWKVKGFISNYAQLRYLLNTDMIEEETKKFLENMIQDAFEKAEITPYFLSGSKGKAGYNLFHNMIANKTILLVEEIGYDYNSLVKLCSKIGISNFDKNQKQRGYGTLVRDYLIKVKVGY